MVHKYVSLENLSKFKVDLDHILDAKQEKLSSAQLTALNSGISSGKVSLYDTAIGDITITKSESTRSCTLTFNTQTINGEAETTNIEIPYGSLIKSLGYDSNSKTLSLYLDNEVQTAFSVVLDGVATLTDLETLSDNINATKEDKPICTYDKTHQLATYSFTDNAEATYTVQVGDEVVLVIPATVKQGFISLLTLINVDDNTLFTVDNQSTYGLKIVANNTTVSGSSYRVISAGKKIIFARCDGSDVEILIIEDIAGS